MLDFMAVAKMSLPIPSILRNEELGAEQRCRARVTHIQGRRLGPSGDAGHTEHAQCGIMLRVTAVGATLLTLTLGPCGARAVLANTETGTQSVPRV